MMMTTEDACFKICAFFNRQSSWKCFEPQQRSKLHFITHNLNQFTLRSLCASHHFYFTLFYLPLQHYYFGLFSQSVGRFVEWSEFVKRSHVWVFMWCVVWMRRKREILLKTSSLAPSYSYLLLLIFPLRLIVLVLKCNFQ